MDELIGSLYQNLIFEEVIITNLWLMGALFLWTIFYLTKLTHLLDKPIDKLYHKLHLDKFWGDLDKQVKLLAKVLKTMFFPNGYNTALLAILVGTFTGLTAYQYYFRRPWVVYQYPAASQPWTDQTEPITIVFDKPVKKDNVRLNISAEVEGELKWEPSFPGWPEAVQTYREVKFVPSSTILPDEDFVVYVVGMETLTGSGGVHEHNADFTAPEVPDINYLSIDEAEVDVMPDVSIEIQFDNANGDFVDWEFVVEPQAEFQIIEHAADRWEMIFSENLEQDTTYNISATRTITQIDLKTEEVLSKFEPETNDILNFTTVSTPGLKEVNIKGNDVLTNKTLIMEFDEAMNTESVLENTTLTPSIDGELSWDEAGVKLSFKPATLWEKDTNYEFLVSGNAQSLAGGKLGEDISHKFKTIGEVKVSSIHPAKDRSNIDVSTHIEIRFNQPVDKDSAQAAFSISPNVGGKFSWPEEKKMVFDTNANLGYSTKYTIKLKKGIKSLYGLDSKAEISSNFTTQSQTFILNVPIYTQQERYTCNVAATRMALAYRSVYLSESGIKSGMGIGPSLSGSTGGNPYTDWIDGYGTYWTNASSYINNYRSTSIKQGWNTADLAATVQAGNPVILWWQNGWSDWYTKSWTTPDGQTISGLNGMHSEVVVGFTGPASNPTQIITNDPWRQRRYYSRSYFENLWGNSFNRTAVVVY